MGAKDDESHEMCIAPERLHEANSVGGFHRT
jgi:hypothetical protein